MSNNNLEKQKKEKLIEVLLIEVLLIEVLLRYTEFLTTRPGKCKVHEYKFNITDTTQFQTCTVLSQNRSWKADSTNGGGWDIGVV